MSDYTAFMTPGTQCALFKAKCKNHNPGNKSRNSNTSARVKMTTLQKLSWHGVCTATSKQASLIMTVLAATMNSSSHLICRLVDVLERVVKVYTHMIND